MKTLTFDAPLAHGERLIATVTLRAPTLKDLRKHGKVRGGMFMRDGAFVPLTYWEVVPGLLADLNAEGLPSAFFDQMTEADAQRAVDLLADFSPAQAATGSPPAPSSSSSASGS